MNQCVHSTSTTIISTFKEFGKQFSAGIVRNGSLGGKKSSQKTPKNQYADINIVNYTSYFIGTTVFGIS